MKRFAQASYVMYFLAGLVITTIGSVLPQILTHYGVSYTMGGQLVFWGAIGFLLGVPISSFLLSRFSEKRILLLACVVIALAQVGMWSLPPFPALIVLNFLNSLGAASVEIVVATLMMEVFVGRRAVVMSYLEVSFGLGALIMPLLSSLLISLGEWRFVFLLTGVTALLMAVVWSVISYSLSDVDHAAPQDAANLAPPENMTPRTKVLLLTLFGFMIFVYCGIEGTMNNFLSSIFITYLEAVPAYASLSIGIFWAAMVLGRLVTGWIIRKVTYSKFLFASLSGSFVVLAAFILLRNIWAGYALIVLLGLFLSGVYSITMVYANHTFPGMARLVTSLITGLAGLGGAVFPALIGYVMDDWGTLTALWMTSGFAVVYLAGLVIVGVSYKKLGGLKTTNTR
ncbi:MFS transporter [Paenibacillus lutrae]|uniref:MFS transporter n=1 Tax=Paenibacillus lutrae TaxID=2078573 RepID=A0A7X3FIL0_9BACL|nr:MFS transporter [Paenibacillus lutrae]MVP00449.1 MFS transporter [Paenibacillus lutrae]